MKKFLFDNDFGTPAEPPPMPQSLPNEAEVSVPEPEIEEPPIPQVEEAEIERIRQQAYAEGARPPGRQAAHEEVEAQSLAILSTCEARLGQLLEQQERMNADTRDDAAAIARAAIKKLFPNFVDRGALQEVEALIATCMERLKGEPRIVIRMCDGLLDPVKERVGKIAQKNGFQGKIVLLAEEDLGPCDVLIEWADGGAERNCGRLLMDIDQILTSACESDAQDDASQTAEDLTAEPDMAVPAERENGVADDTTSHAQEGDRP